MWGRLSSVESCLWRQAHRLEAGKLVGRGKVSDRLSARGLGTSFTLYPPILVEESISGLNGVSP
jgi:hypothetical protein